jgi:succinate dehydrogenase / fumarate reductase flavoprotein subunit
MYRQFVEWQMLDISREPMEVAPTAHYTMGGIVVDPETHATNVPGLYAAGECVGGLHGANRLGGNSLGEALISGRRAGEAAAAFGLESEVLVRSRRAIDEGLTDLDALTRPGVELARPLQRRLRDLMWERCGVVRSESGLRQGLSELQTIREAAAEIDVRPGAEGWTDLALALDLRAGLAVAEATLRGAIERRESRGAHYRTDFADLDPALQVNFYIDARMDPWSEPVPTVPDALRPWIERPLELGAERLLE